MRKLIEEGRELGAERGKRTSPLVPRGLRGRCKKGRGRGGGREESAKEGKREGSPPPYPLPLPSLPNPLPFSLPPYPLPLSMPATQATFLVAWLLVSHACCRSTVTEKKNKTAHNLNRVTNYQVFK